MGLVLVSFTLIYRAACPLLVKHSTINLSLTSEESLRDSKLPVTGYLSTKGQESVYETCACVIHTILLSYMCINVCAGFRHLARSTLNMHTSDTHVMIFIVYHMCFVKL